MIGPGARRSERDEIEEGLNDLEALKPDSWDDDDTPENSENDEAEG